METRECVAEIGLGEPAHGAAIHEANQGAAVAVWVRTSLSAGTASGPQVEFQAPDCMCRVDAETAVPDLDYFA